MSGKADCIRLSTFLFTRPLRTSVRNELSFAIYCASKRKWNSSESFSLMVFRLKLQRLFRFARRQVELDLCPTAKPKRARALTLMYDASLASLLPISPSQKSTMAIQCFSPSRRASKHHRVLTYKYQSMM